MIVKSLIPRKIEILVGSLALTVFGAAIVAGCVIMVTESQAGLCAFQAA